MKKDDQGAAAVEFALVSILLFTLLFGIIQYGYLFFQYQAGAATAHEGARLAVTGMYRGTFQGTAWDECNFFGFTVAARGEANGLDTDSVRQVDVTFSEANPQRGDTVTVAVTFKPTTFGAAFVPMPSQIVSTAVGTVEEVGTMTTSTCTWNAP